MKAQTKHCIITPDFIGPIKNGGIGTACYELAKFLSTRCDAQVTILFTSVVVVDSAEKWSTDYWEKRGWRFLSVADLPRLPTISHHNSHWCLERSLPIHKWLQEQDFTHIHFQDWHANGFVPIQAKRAGLAYSNTVLTCTVHSPQEWSEEGSLLFPDGGIEPMLQRHSEKYAASHADITIFPSRHMLEYVRARGWSIDHPVVVPYLFGRARESVSPASCKVTELCFFGRLETRKGLEVFLGALERLMASRGVKQLPKVTFLGKPGLVTSGESLDYLKNFQKRYAVDFTILSDFDAEQAQQYLKADSGRIAVTPSLLDNLPYVVIECLQNGVPLIASNIGGIPELIGSEEHLFRPNAKDLADLLERITDHGCPPIISTYDLEKAQEWWKALSSSRASTSAERRSVDPAQITVCIAYYNYGKYLPDLLESLTKQTVSGFGVVVVNDGSTDDFSKSVFAEMQSKYSHRPNWHFVTQNNGGIGVARNRAASLADTEYLVFMDADNLAKPRMIERMATAMATSNADCLTCYMEGFRDGNESGMPEVVYRYTPTGNCPEAGCFENIFGDANCIVRRDAFEDIGRFSLDRDSSFEDWEFLAKMSLNGKRLDVIPEFLHLYRHTDQGFSRNTSAFRNRRRILNAYQAHLPDWAGRLLECAYASVTDIKELTQPRGALSNLPSLTEAALRMVRIAAFRFDSARYLSMYRTILTRRGGFTDWSKIPRIHYILFGSKFPI